MDPRSIVFLEEIFLEAVTLFVAFGVVFTFILGLWLLLQPAGALRFIDISSKGFSLRRWMKPLQIPRYQEKIFYRYNKPLGAVLLAGAIYSLYYFIFDYNQASLTHAFSRYFNVSTTDWLLEVMNIFLVAGNVFVMLIGFTILFFPGSLKAFEEKCNSWISTRNVYKVLDIENKVVDSMLLRYPRALGMLIVLTSFYVLTTFTVLVVTKNLSLIA